MWARRANCLREVSREVLGVSKDYSSGCRGDWWWNREVQGKFEARKATYLKLVESNDEDEKRANKKWYKSAKLVITTTFERLYKQFGDQGRDKNLYILAKESEKNARDIEKSKCIK